MHGDPNEYINPYSVNQPLLLYKFPIFQAGPSLAILLGSLPFDFFVEGLILSCLWFIGAHYLLTDERVNETIHRLWSYGLLDILVKYSKSIPNPLIKRFFS